MLGQVLFMLPAALWPPGLAPLPPVEGRLSLAPGSESRPLPNQFSLAFYPEYFLNLVSLAVAIAVCWILVYSF